MTTKAWDVASKHIMEWILATSIYFILQKRMIPNIIFEDSNDDAWEEPKYSVSLLKVLVFCQ
mgnify:CR=1 FL=1